MHCSLEFSALRRDVLTSGRVMLPCNVCIKGFAPNFFMAMTTLPNKDNDIDPDIAFGDNDSNECDKAKDDNCDDDE